jgi:hypothetical protein
MFRRMHTQIRANHPLSSGFGMIHFTLDWNGVDVLVHGGDWPGTHSGMMLFPQVDTGIFFSLLAERPDVPVLESILGSERLTAVPGVTVDTPITNFGVMYGFLERFFGKFRGPARADDDVNLDDYVGSYVGRSAPFSTMERLLNLGSAFNVINVTLDDTGSGLLFNGKGPYKAIGKDVFRDETYTSPLDGFFLDSPIYGFTRDEAGAVDYVVPQIGFDVWVKSGPLQNPQTWTTALGVVFLVGLSGLVAAFYPRVPRRRLAKWLPVIMALGLIALPLIVLLGQADGDTIVDDLFFGRAGRFVLLGIAANLLALAALLQAWYAVRAWRESFWSEARLGGVMRVHYGLVGVAALVLVPVLAYWRLLGL